jgi:hypothetical protein
LIISTIADNEASATTYTSAGSTIDTIATLGTFATPTATHCRFKEVDATNHKGIYEIQIDNARYAVSNSKSLTVSVSGASGLAECDVTIPLRSVDPYDGVRFNLTALPNVAAAAAGGLPTVGTGTGQINVTGGRADANVLFWNSSAVVAPNVTGIPKVDVVDWLGTTVTAATAGIPDVNTKNISGSAVSTSSAQIGINVVNWNGSAVATPNIPGIPKVDVTDWLGTAVTAATAGIPDVNTKNYNNHVAVTDINNFPSVNLVDISGSAVNATIAQLGVNIVNWNGSAVAVPNVAGVPKVDIVDWLGTTVTAAAAGVPDVNVKNYNNHTAITDTNNYPSANVIDWNGSAVSAPNIAGIPKVDLADWLGSAPNALSNGRVDSILNGRSGTCQGIGGANTIQLDAGASLTDQWYNDWLVLITSGTGVGQLRSIISYVGSTQTATVYPAWRVTPTGTSTFTLIPAGQVDVGAILQTASVGMPGYIGIDWAQIANKASINNLSGTIIASVSGSIGSISGVTFPANFSAFAIDVSGRVDIGKILGTASAGATGYVGVDWAKITNKTATVALTNTTIAGGGGGGGGDPAAIAAAILATPITPAVPNTIGGALAKVGTARTTVVSPVSEDSNLTLIRGDSYLALFGRAIQWINDSTDTAGALWPDLSEMTIQLEINEGQLIAPGSVLVPTGAIKKVQVELTSRQTNTLGVGVFDYNLVGIFVGTGTGTGSDRMTLASGQVAVMAREDQP